MADNYLTDPLEFLISTLFGLYILAIMLRLLLQWVRADFYNPVSQFLVKITTPALRPLRRIVPGWGGVDLAAVVLLLALQMVALLLIGALRGYSFNPVNLLVLSVAELLSLLLNIYMVTIIVQAVISWINPSTYNPMSSLLYSLNEPVLQPARRLIPPISGLDLSPLVVLLGLQLLKMLLIRPLLSLA